MRRATLIFLHVALLNPPPDALCQETKALGLIVSGRMVNELSANGRQGTTIEGLFLKKVIFGE